MTYSGYIKHQRGVDKSISALCKILNNKTLRVDAGERNERREEGEWGELFGEGGLLSADISEYRGTLLFQLLLIMESFFCPGGRLIYFLFLSGRIDFSLTE